MRPSLLGGQCNGEDHITPGPAALRDFNPAYVGSGSKAVLQPCRLQCPVCPKADIGNCPQGQSRDCSHSPNGLYGTLGCEWTCYSLIFAARMTLPHFSFSAAMNFPNSAGEVAKTVSPQSTIVCLILGSARPALIALLSTSMLAAGVSFGAVTPNQPTAS